MCSKVIYGCALHSITPDINIYKNSKKRENIEYADTKVVSRIMVKPTFIKNIYREIITGKMIPAYRLIFNRNKCFYKVQVPLSTVFIKVEEEINNENKELSYTNNLHRADEQDVKKYIEENKSKEEFKEYLDRLFEQGEEYYEDALAKKV